MATEDDKDQKDRDPGEDQDQKDRDQKDQDSDGEDQDQKDQDGKDSGKTQDPELKRAIQRRDRALKEKQKLEDRVRELEEKYEAKKADPVAAANRRLVTAEARVVMTAAGITDAGDQRTLQGFLGLDDVSVSEDGEVDSAAIQERLEDLAAIFGKLAKNGGQGGKRTPRTDTRDRAGEKPSPKDAQSARRRAMLMGR